jgi:hypothetical protein
MKNIFLLVVLFTTINAKAQGDKTVTLTVIGQGNSIDEAHTKALKNSIEQAFGAFVSTKTEILNDKLSNDVIATISNGNVQNYEIINDTKLPDGTFVSTLKATVSVSKLTSFCESKGISVEFKGGLFAQNMAIQELNGTNEKIAWANTKKIILELLSKGVDYKLENINQPRFLRDSFYLIDFYINISLNKNYSSAMDLLQNFCKSIGLSEEEATDYIKLNKKIFTLFIPNEHIRFKDITYNTNKYDKINKGDYIINNKISFNRTILRNANVFREILILPYDLIHETILNFKLNDGQGSIMNFQSGGDAALDLNKEILSFTFRFVSGYSITDFPDLWIKFYRKDHMGGDFQDNNFRFYDRLDYSRNTIQIFSKGYDYIKSEQFAIYDTDDKPRILNFTSLKDNFLLISFSKSYTLEQIKNIKEFKVTGKVN